MIKTIYNVEQILVPTMSNILENMDSLLILISHGFLTQLILMKILPTDGQWRYENFSLEHNFRNWLLQAQIDFGYLCLRSPIRLIKIICENSTLIRFSQINKSNLFQSKLLFWLLRFSHLKIKLLHSSIKFPIDLHYL